MKNTYKILTVFIFCLSNLFGQINFEIDTLSFGPLTVDSTLTFEASITSDIVQDVTLLGIVAPFSLNTTSLSFSTVGQTQNISVTFSPTTANTFVDEIIATGTIYGSDNLVTTGEGTLVQIGTNVSTISFGEVSIGQTGTANLIITNNGTGTMLVTNIESDNSQFYASPTTMNIGTGGSNTTIVTFAPTNSGENSATLTISSTDPNSPTITVSLSGTGKTDISGDVSGTWIASNNPYHIVGDITVPNGETLTIDPGVEIIFDSEYTIEVNGNMICDGTESDSIYFSGGGNLHFNSADSPTELKYCNVGTAIGVTGDGLYDSFERSSLGDNWTGTGSVGITTSYYYSGSRGMYIEAYDADAFAESRNYVVGSETNVSYWFRAIYSDNNCYFRFFIKVNNGNWSEIYTYGSNTGWSFKSHDLSSYITTGDSVSFKFMSDIYSTSSSYDQQYSYIDDFNFNGEYSGPTQISSTSCQFSIENSTLNKCQISSSGSNASITIINTDIPNSSTHGLQTSGNNSDITLTNCTISNPSSYGIYVTGASSEINMTNSNIINTGGYGIYTSCNGCDVSLDSSSVYNMPNAGIYTNDQNSPVTLSNSSVYDNNSYGIYSGSSYSPVTLTNSDIYNHTSNIGIKTQSTQSPITLDSCNIYNNTEGLYAHSTYSPIVISNSDIYNNSSHGVHAYNSNSPISITYSEIKSNGGHGIYSQQGAAGITVSYSKILNNTSSGVYCAYYPIHIDYSIIKGNGDYGVRSGASTNYFSWISFSTVFENTDYGIYFSGSVDTEITNSILWNNNSGNAQYNTVGSASYNCIQNYSSGSNIDVNPIFIDDDQHVASNSPTIDGADPYFNDNYMPPGQGALRADMGIYGGPNNHIWGEGDTIPSGVPTIDNIQDLPQDQGGYVGIQYQASIFDYAHTAYDISEYSFWRAMVLIRSETIDPEHIENGLVIHSRNEYWELVGSMPAQGFEQYGYSAETLGDSTASGGIFWSKYLVIAHTNSTDTYFLSAPDSGYSVDNIPPYAPESVVSNLDVSGTLTVEWEVYENTDIYNYDVYRDNELYLTVVEPLFTDELQMGDLYSYQIRGIDIHENVGEFSEPFIFNYGTLGDVTLDGTINVLDILNIVDIIMSGNTGFSDGALWAADLNSDATTDIFDLVQLVDNIMGGAGRVLASNAKAAIFNQGTSVYLSSPAPVQGLELTLSSEVEEIMNQTGLVFHHQGDKVLMYSMGDQSLSGDKINLFELPEGVTIKAAKVAGPGGQRYETSVAVVPETFAVHQNYPNPFNPSTSIQIDLPEITDLSVVVYDAMGREVHTLVNEELLPGYHTLTWNGTDRSGKQVASGVYFIRVLTQGNTKTIKSMLIR